MNIEERLIIAIATKVRKQAEVASYFQHAGISHKYAIAS